MERTPSTKPGLRNNEKVAYYSMSFLANVAPAKGGLGGGRRCGSIRPAEAAASNAEDRCAKSGRSRHGPERAEILKGGQTATEKSTRADPWSRYHTGCGRSKRTQSRNRQARARPAAGRPRLDICQLHRQIVTDKIRKTASLSSISSISSICYRNCVQRS